jgi:hypothetical protein
VSKGVLPLRWFSEYRLAWIKESVEIFGRINREHICRKFGVSVPQASIDLNKALVKWPGLMIYNKQSKQYELKETNEPDNSIDQSRGRGVD